MTAEADDWKRWLLILSPFLLAIIGFVGYSVFYHGQAAAAELQEEKLPELWTLRINAGGDRYEDEQGIVWEADRDYLSGMNWSNPVPIAGTNDSALYQSERWGNDWFVGIPYVFAVPNGAYKVRMHFAEIYDEATQPGDRVFDIYVQGKPAYRGFDILEEVAPRTALVKTVDAAVANGTLSILFKHGVSQNPKISAIELIKYSENFTQAVDSYQEIARFDNAVVLAERSWLADHNFTYFTGGDATSWFVQHIPQGSEIYDPANLLNWSALERPESGAVQSVVDMPYWFQGDHEFYLKAAGQIALHITKRDINRVEGRDRLAIIVSDIQDNEFDRRIIGDDNNPTTDGNFLVQEQDVLFDGLAPRLYKVRFVGLEGSDFTYDITANTSRMIVANRVFTKQPHSLQFSCVLECNITLTPFPATPAQDVLIDGQPFAVQPQSEPYSMVLHVGNHSLRATQGNVLVTGFGVGSMNEAQPFTLFQFVRSDHETTFVVRPPS